MKNWEKSYKMSLKIDALVGLGMIWIFVSSNLIGCGVANFDASSLSDFSYAGKIKLNIARSQGNLIVVAAAPTATSLKFCEGLVNCQPSDGGYKEADFLKSVSQPGKPQFFLVRLTTALSSDLSVNFIANDSSGKPDHRLVKFVREAPTGGTPAAPAAGGGISP